MGQTVNARLLDARTQQGIPYATVQYGPQQGVISNGEGHFSLALEKGSPWPDSIHISSMGYGTKAFALGQLGDSLLYMEPQAIELQGVYLFDKNLEVGDIIQKMKERLPENINASPLRQRVFMRRSNLTDIDRLDLGFEQSTIAELDRDLIDSLANSVPKRAHHYSESLMDLYRKGGEYKLDLIKAAELYSKDNVASLEELGQRMETIFKKNIKRDSYLKIKSGIFSQKVQVDSILESMETEDSGKVGQGGEKDTLSGILASQRSGIRELLGQLYYRKESRLDLIEKTKRYTFTLTGYSEIDGEGVYVIAFAPKRGRADFKGLIYINIEDFAVMRMDFGNTQRLRNFNLLGITYREERYQGSARFSKLPNGRYALRFLDLTQGHFLAVDRPLKVVEKNKHVKGRRKQNELSLNLDFRMRPTEKWELVVFTQQLVEPSVYTDFKEDKDTKARYLPAYDPTFWEGHNIMEPNQALREFKAGE